MIPNEKKLKVASYGLTVGRALPNGDILILGLSDETLRAANSYYPHLPPELDLFNVIPPNNLFFYKIENFDGQSYPKRQLLECEIGVGEMVKENKQLVLKRHYPKKIYNELDGWSFLTRGFAFTQDTELIITTRPPETFDDLFIVKDSVICSLGGGIPEIVPVKNNEVVGMIGGDLKSVKITEIFENTSDPLVTTSNRLELNGKNSTIYCNSINLKSQRSRPDNPMAGTIIYNNKKKAFEGYDGEQWRTLKWE